MKATMLLTIALFLGLAPAPDAATIAEFSAQFIVLEPHQALQAAEGVEEATRKERAPATAHPHIAESNPVIDDTAQH